VFCGSKYHGFQFECLLDFIFAYNLSSFVQDGKCFIGRKLASEEQIFSGCFPSLQQQTPSIEVLEKASGILSKIPKQQNSGFLPRTLGIHDFVEKLVSESLPMKHINKAKTKAHLNKRQRL